MVNLQNKRGMSEPKVSQINTGSGSIEGLSKYSDKLTTSSPMKALAQPRPMIVPIVN